MLDCRGSTECQVMVTLFIGCVLIVICFICSLCCKAIMGDINAGKWKICEISVLKIYQIILNYIQ
jgi:hypothetical protein